MYVKDWDWNDIKAGKWIFFWYFVYIVNENLPITLNYLKVYDWHDA